jgi:hypothetical protein
VPPKQDQSVPHILVHCEAAIKRGANRVETKDFSGHLTCLAVVVLTAQCCPKQTDRTAACIRSKFGRDLDPE